MHEPTVVLYELNEVPWTLVDEFVRREPRSTIAGLLRRGTTWTTVNDDEAHLSPWRTWPTVHRSMYTADHNSWELGQDPATFRGVDLWDALDAAGMAVGLFGVLQSWPPREFASGGFCVPDTFASDASTVPPGLSTFQDFNLRMTSENAFSSDAPLAPRDLARVGVDLVRRGLTPDSARRLAWHLVQERRDARHQAGRAMMQVLPAFDLYRGLLRTHRPRFSAFFTNHVAAMMHRYWGDAMPGYAEQFEYDADPVYGSFVIDAMRLADRQLRRIERGLRPGDRLVVASSMGQGPIDHRVDVADLLVLDDGPRLAAFLGCGPAVQRLAMHPMCSLEFHSDASATAAAATLAEVVDHVGRPLFDTIERQGATVLFRTSYEAVAEDDPRTARRTSAPEHTASYDELGLAVRGRLGGSNTAYHVPEGILLDVPAQGGDGADARTPLSVLDVAPSLLATVYGVDVPASMKGGVDGSLFR
ncbi:hypothetical protein ACQPX6_25275 [Actinomycetospora sp. CA-101289]|uniref:hypothetical protein n=1 Tax=Actinomycetospora sp. CA-101289 TaxID=3239893 RepID=UPI003D969CA2